MNVARPAMRAAGRALRAAACVALLAAAAPAPGAGTVLYQKTSAYNTVIVTDEGDGLRALRFAHDGVRQSLVKLGDPEHLGLAYLRVALAGLALCAEPQRILVLGLGGGSLPAFLRRHYPQAEIDAVDIDAEVARVAKEYFGFREDARMRVHIADGRRFIEAVRRPYDAIYLDAFGASAVPPHLVTAEFLAAVRGALRAGGVAVGNVWSGGANPLYDSMVRTYAETFDTLYVLAVPDSVNRILLALPRRESLAPAELTALARRLAADKGFRFDLGELVERGLLPAPPAGGRVLRDADGAR
jgi:spermidine synthase